SGSNCGGPASACGELFRIGIRPVAIWKSTEAAPTPISEGATSVPSPLSPWQVAQFVRNSSWPASTSSVASPAAASAGWGAKAAYMAPVRLRASRTNSAGANRLRLLAASAFTIWRPRVSGAAGKWRGRCGLQIHEGVVEHVDHEEQADPYHVDEMPVVRRDNG